MNYQKQLVQISWEALHCRDECFTLFYKLLRVQENVTAMVSVVNNSFVFENDLFFVLRTNSVGVEER